MRSFAFLFLLILLSLTVFSQKPKTTKTTVKPVETPVVNAANEKEEFEKAVALTDPAARITALKKFVNDFPKSAEKNRALELIVSARGQIGDDKLRAGETESGIAFFKLAVAEAPTPISDQLFTLLLQFPTNVFSRGQNPAAVEIAKTIEEKIGENPKQLLALATYYLGTENAFEAKRLAEKAIQIETNLTEKPAKSNLPAAYQTLGFANRMNFDFTDSANAYAKALELDPASAVSRRGLAEIKRALGKPDEAIALYNEILAKDATDLAAQTGLILSLFDAGKKQEAEAEMTKALEANPNNLFLLVGAAYWYAAQNDGAKAVELAQKALAVEPKYTWAHIALARGYMAQKHPLEAERILLTARQYGDFPTLDYELASARFKAGFFREAGDILKRNFSIKEDYVKAWMGNRVPLEAMSFMELLAVERQASIFQPLAADNSANAEKLKSLLEFVQKLDVPDVKDEELAALGEKFIAGDDEMKLYRQLFVAKKLLQQKKALPKVLELTAAATGKVDTALAAPNAAAAILADALYESRTFAMSRGEVIIVPNLPQQTLSKILRGDIEEVSGWTLFQQNKSAEAIIRLKRGLSILPANSAWWRSSMWRLGSALEADGKPAEALESYIKVYLSDAADAGRYLIIEALYQKINGNTEGLIKRIGNKPVLVASQIIPQKMETSAVPMQTPTVEATPAQMEVKPAETSTPQPLPANETKIEPTPTPTPQEVKAVETPTPLPLPAVETKIEPTPTQTPQEIKTEETPNPTPQPSPLAETKTEITPAVQTEKTSEVVAKNQSETETKPAETPQNLKTEKPLFEPIIITIPQPPTVKKSETETKPVDKIEDEKLDSGETRVRKVAQNKTEEIAPCTIVVSQESISILRAGSLGVLVGFETEGDLKEIKAISSSPNDVEIIVEPEIDEASGRVLFLIKSISTNKGAFTVTFEAPCGKKEIMVKVR